MYLVPALPNAIEEWFHRPVAKLVDECLSPAAQPTRSHVGCLREIAFRRVRYLTKPVRKTSEKDQSFRKSPTRGRRILVPLDGDRTNGTTLLQIRGRWEFIWVLGRMFDKSNVQLAL